MKESSSPFAALTTRERLERWNLWQSQHRGEMLAVQEQTDGDDRSESVLIKSKPTESRVVNRSHHSQYDAVVKRMRQAMRGAGSYQTCVPAESTRQESSGSL